MIKRCTRCGETKPSDAFGKNSAERDGLQRWCRPCRGEHARQAKPGSRPEVRSYHRAYRQANREHIRRRKQEWVAANPLYHTWSGMIRRCHNPDTHNYERYGGRGIRVWNPWHDYEVFAAYVETYLGPRPESCSIDRRDNDGDYEPGNLRWATAKEQAANRRPRALRKVA